jgi:sec-independent protein translocase protein TatA
MGFTSIWHWIIVLAVVLILFARPGKISGIMGDFGKGLRSFKEGVKNPEEDAEVKGIEESPAKKAAPKKPAKKAAPKKPAKKAAPKKTAKKKSATKKAAKKKA